MCSYFYIALFQIPTIRNGTAWLFAQILSSARNKTRFITLQLLHFPTLYPPTNLPLQ
jgi:hypothetical protein